MSTMADQARAIADLTDGTVVATVDIEARPERVFEALTNGDEVPRWWGSPDHYRTTQWIGDVRPGGRWRASGVRPDGGAFSIDGEYIEVVPARKIVQTWKAPWDGGNTTTITIRLEPIDGGTRVTLWHQGFAGRPDACGNHANGWERVLGWLKRYVSPAAAEKRYFLCRLIPPRPTFAQDMSAEEADMMKRHAVYWTELLARGSAIVFGPVGDPAGVWGMVVVRAADEAEVKALTAADPAIAAGRGLRFEVLPMLRAVTRA